MDVLRAADALRIYLTGASSDGGTQADPDNSRGRYRSSTEAVFLTSFIETGLSNITVDYASGANGPGTGTLTATGASALTWTPPNGTAGDPVTIANGETKIIEGGALESWKYVRVSRTSATALSGAASIELADEYDGVVGMEGIDSDTATAGVTKYRLLALRNDHAQSGVKMRDLSAWIAPVAGASIVEGDSVAHTTVLGSSGAGTVQIAGSNVNTFAAWPEAGWALCVRASATELIYYTARTSRTLTVPAAGRGLGGTSAAAGATDETLVPWGGLTIAFEEPDAQPDGEYSGWSGSDFEAPSGLTWRAPYNTETALPFGNVDSGEQVGLWIRWEVPAGAVASAGSPLRVINLDWKSVD